MIYETPPKNFKPVFDVVGCFFEYERSGYAAEAGSGGEMLLLHRNLTIPQGGKWGMPAGKVEQGKSLVNAMIRELREETGHKIQEREICYFDKVYVNHPEHQFVYHMFSLLLQGKPDIIIDPQEHQAFMWISPRHAFALPLVTDLDKCIKRFYQIS